MEKLPQYKELIIPGVCLACVGIASASMFSKIALHFALFCSIFWQLDARNGDPPVSLYEVSDEQGLGRRFDGIGGLSGGGVS